MCIVQVKMRRWTLLLLVLPFCQGQDSEVSGDTAASTDPEAATSDGSGDTVTGTEGTGDEAWGYVTFLRGLK